MSERIFTRIHGGRIIYLDDIKPGDIRIEDIAFYLARIPRFNGGGTRTYSVAEHSIWCSRVVGERHRFQALMHDAPEYLTGDVTTPVKQMLGDKMVELEQRIWAAICEKFELSPFLSEEVKWADKAAYYRERDSLGFNPRYNQPDWDDPQEKEYQAREPLLDLTPAEAKELFLLEFNKWRHV